MSSSDIASHLPNLPDEIWIKVFSFLSLDDRKSIRLSCFRFHEISNSWSRQKTESMVFYGNLNTDAALEFFSSFKKREIWNIKLNMVHLMDDSILSFFKKQGTKVRSLILDNCTVAPRLLKSIIESCENLVEFSLSFSYHFGQCHLNTNELAIIFNEFKALQESGIICQSVTNFTFKFNIMNYDNRIFIVTNKKFLDIFDVFPNIRKLDLTFLVDWRYNYNQFSTVFSDITLDKQLSFSCIYYQLFKMRSQLERLTLTFLSKFVLNGPVDPLLQTLNKFSCLEIRNLEELSLNFEIETPATDISIDHLKYLTKLECTLNFDALQIASASSIIQVILNTATQLHSLTIDTETKFYINENCFQALVQSRLTNLSILSVSNMRLDFDYLSLEGHVLPNYSLKYLNLFAYDYNVILLFSTYFHYLETLNVATFDERILENIFNYQTKLRNLVLRNKFRHTKFSCPKVSSTSLRYWLENQNQFSHRFDHLTYLKIVEEESLDLSEFLLSKFVFPKLNSLHIIVLNSSQLNSNTDLFCKAIQKLTALEYLELNADIEISFLQCLTLCSTLLKLRYILIFNKFPIKLFDNSEYHQLFEVNPSLRVVFHRNYSSTNAVKYFKDIMSNTVQNIGWPHNNTVVFNDSIDELLLYNKFTYEGIPTEFSRPTTCI